MKKGNQMSREQLYVVAVSIVFIASVCATSLHADSIPAALETLVAEDGSTWERVCAPGFGNKNNIAIEDLLPFKGNLYAVTRNEASGFEIWRTNGSAWEQILVPGFTDSVFHDLMNNGYGAMIEFNDHLYIAVGSGYEGAFLYGSVGFEMWRFNGSTWEPVISNSRDADEAGVITAISGCKKDDGNTTAEISDSSKNWVPEQWTGGLLRITSGDGRGRVFTIISNTATTLVIQQNEVANTSLGGTETEYTVCDEITPDAEHRELTAGAVNINDTFEIGTGADENGFGELWNKNFIDFAVFNGELYASIAHNYEAGTRIWKTSDGLTWSPASPYSFGLFHGYDLQGNPTGRCLVEGTEDRNGAPVCSSSTSFALSAVSGTPTLYIGGTGSSGCNGRGARVLRLDGNAWNFIVDYFVDDNISGTNENGLGDAGSFISSNFQAWSWAEYDERLFVGVARVTGGRIMYTETGSSDDSAWTYVVGGDSSILDGFDGVSGLLGYGANIVPLLYVHNSSLYVGTVANNLTASLPPSALDGADLWRATGSADSLVWTRVTSDGFRDKTHTVIGPFTSFKTSLYGAASNLFGGFAADEPAKATGATIYRLAEIPRIAAVSSLKAATEKFSVALNWTTDSEFDCAGFNIYRCASEKNNAPYRRVNRSIIKATGAKDQVAVYGYTDNFLRPNKTYFYKLEAVSFSGNSIFYGPLQIITKPILNAEQ